MSITIGKRIYENFSVICTDPTLCMARIVRSIMFSCTKFKILCSGNPNISFEKRRRSNVKKVDFTTLILIATSHSFNPKNCSAFEIL